MIHVPHPGRVRSSSVAKRRRGFAVWRWLLVLAACVGVAFGGWVGWRWFDLPRRLSAALPAHPATEDWPREFHDRLAAAEQRVTRRAEALEGVADLGRLYHANGFRAEAETCWRLLRIEQPREARWSHMLADLRRAASDYDAMESFLREVVRKDPDYSPAWLKWGDYLLKTGRLDEARRAYTERLGRVPGDPYAMLGLARVALLSDQRAEARRLIDAIVAAHPRFSPAQNLLAELLAAEGDEAGAARRRQLGNVAIRFFEAEDPWLDELVGWCLDPERLRILATIEYQIERGDRGVALMERAVRLAPGDPDALSSLGDLYVKLGDARRARDVLEPTLRAGGTRKPPVLDFLNLSLAYRLLKQPAEALRVVEMARVVHPDAYECFDELGIILGELGRAEESIAAFQRALGINPASADTHLRLAVALLESGRRQEAYAALDRALEHKPDYPPALSLLGRVELEDGRLEDAEKHIRVLYEAYPDVYESKFMLGVVQLIRAKNAESAGDQARAEQDYRAGIAIDATNPELQAGLGLLLLVQGRTEESVALLETYRRLQPAEPQSALLLGQAYARLGRVMQARAVLNEGVEQAERAGNRATADLCREVLRSLP